MADKEGALGHEEIRVSSGIFFFMKLPIIILCSFFFGLNILEYKSQLPTSEVLTTKELMKNGSQFMG